MDEKLSDHIHLFGSPEENFYALGKRDKDSFSEIYKQITRLCARADFLAKALKTSAELAGNLQSKGRINISKELSAYAEGLERPLSDVQFLFLLPEIVASFNKWLPNLMGLIPGCSSLFRWDPAEKAVLHGRVLDYAVAGPFERHERSVTYEFKDMLRVYGHSSAGMPLPSLTSMNDRGLTMALHYKHGNFLDLKGDSIFAIAYKIITYCSDIHDVKKFLKNYPSMSHWGIYLSDKSGQVASIDVRGREIYQEKFDLKEFPYLYFNNRPLLKDPALKTTQPFGSLGQCKMRRDSVAKALKEMGKEDLKDIDLLKALTRPISKKGASAAHWNMHSTTPSTVQAVVFNNAKLSSISVSGESPKIFDGVYREHVNVFKNEAPRSVQTNDRYSEPNNLRAYNYLAKFQSYLDAGEIEKAYHSLQMAKELFTSYPEATICLFYIYILEYLYETESKEQAYLHEDLNGLQGQLPEYLEDHRKLFLMRLEKILGHPLSMQEKDIKNPNLRKLFVKETKLRKEAIKVLRKFIFPRVEILDILYAY